MPPGVKISWIDKSLPGPDDAFSGFQKPTGLNSILTDITLKQHLSARNPQVPLLLLLTYGCCMVCSLQSMKMASSLLQRATQQAEALQDTALSGDPEQDSTIEERLVLVGEFCAMRASLSHCPQESEARMQDDPQASFKRGLLKLHPLTWRNAFCCRAGRRVEARANLGPEGGGLRTAARTQGSASHLARPMSRTGSRSPLRHVMAGVSSKGSSSKEFSP